MKAIIYGRVSSDQQKHDRQISELQEYARKNEIEVLEIFTDTMSGKHQVKKRPGTRSMFEYIGANKIDIVLVSEISRLGRSAIDVQKNIHEIVFSLGLNLYVHQQGMTARGKSGKVNSSFKLITDVLANVAEMESEILSERIKSGLAEARRKGKTIGRPTGTKKTVKDILIKYHKVVRTLNAGLSIRDVAKVCGVSTVTVQKVKSAMTVAEMEIESQYNLK